MMTVQPGAGPAIRSDVLDDPEGPKTLLRAKRCAALLPSQPRWTCVACAPAARPVAETVMVVVPLAEVTRTEPPPAPARAKVEEAGCGGAGAGVGVATGTAGAGVEVGTGGAAGAAVASVALWTVAALVAPWAQAAPAASRTRITPNLKTGLIPPLDSAPAYGSPPGR